MSLGSQAIRGAALSIAQFAARKPKTVDMWAPLKDLALARWFIGLAVLAGIAAAFFLLHGLFPFWLFCCSQGVFLLFARRFSVVHKAFGEYSWCNNNSTRNPKTTLSFSTFL